LESVFFVSFSGPCDPVHNPNSRPKQKENCCRERDGYNWKKIELVMKLFFSLGFVRIPVDQGHGEYGTISHQLSTSRALDAIKNGIDTYCKKCSWKEHKG
jgi:hypothetical protein